MLTNLCVEKIINLTKEIREPCPITLEWIVECWSYIKHVPSIDLTLCYYALGEDCYVPESHFDLTSSDVLRTVCTLNPYLRLKLYKRDGQIYINLKKQVYEKLLENKDVKNHLEFGIRGLLLHVNRTTQSMESEGKLLNFKTFLSTCKLFKYVKFDSRSFEEKTMSLILQDLVSCHQIEQFVGLGYYYYLSDECFCKYLLGIDFLDVGKADRMLRTKNVNFIEKLKRIILLSEPSWPKIVSIQDCHCYHGSIGGLIGILSFLILKNLKHFNSRTFIKSYYTSYNETIQKELQVCFNYDFLAKIVNYLYIDGDDIQNFNKIKAVFTENPYLYEHISYVNFTFYSYNLYVRQSLMEIVSKAPNLKWIRLYSCNVYSSIVDDTVSPICPVVIQNMSLVCNNEHFNQINNYIFTSFPFIKNLTMIINSLEYFVFCSMPDLNYLESVHVIVLDPPYSDKALISYMNNISCVVQKHTKLTYLMTKLYGSLTIHSILRSSGWLQVLQLDIPYIGAWM